MRKVMIILTFMFSLFVMNLNSLYSQISIRETTTQLLLDKEIRLKFLPDSVRTPYIEPIGLKRPMMIDFEADSVAFIVQVSYRGGLKNSLTPADSNYIQLDTLGSDVTVLIQWTTPDHQIVNNWDIDYYDTLFVADSYLYFSYAFPPGKTSHIKAYMLASIEFDEDAFIINEWNTASEPVYARVKIWKINKWRRW